MVKTAYQKLCFYPLVRVTVFGLLLSALLVPVPWPPERWGRAGGACFGVDLPGIRRSARDFACGGRDPLCDPDPAGKPPSARSPSLVRDRLEQDLQTGDRINDLYFTSDFLLVYQLQFRRKQGFACIPYPEMRGVSIGQNGRAKISWTF